MKKILAFFGVALAALALSAKADAQSVYGNFGLMTKNVWRGLESAKTVTVLPEVGFEAGNFCVYALGAYALDDSYGEFDFGFTYTLGAFTLDVCDYFYPACAGDNPEDERFKFFNWNNSTTGHQLDVMLWFEPENVPIKAMISCIPYGDDKKEDGSHNFSTYAQVGWYHDFENENHLEFNVGASLFASPLYETESFGVNVLELLYTKTFTFKSIEIPIGIQGVFNAVTCKPYLCLKAAIGF